MFSDVYGFYCCMYFAAHRKKKGGGGGGKTKIHKKATVSVSEYFGVPGNAGSLVFIPDSVRQ